MLFTDPDLLERAGDIEPFLDGEFDFDRDLIEPKIKINNPLNSYLKIV